jgi:hypothetical protein
MWLGAVRAIAFNLIGFSLCATMIALQGNVSPWAGLALALTLLGICRSSLRPAEAMAPFRSWEWVVWIGGFAAIPLGVLFVSQLIEVDVLKVATLCWLGWAFCFLGIRDTYLATHRFRPSPKT